MARDADVVVVGAGIIGLATARAILARHPRASVLVLEKEAGVARHQSGRNSGVLHAGIYYPAGSRKADLCREGRTMMLDLCARAGIPVAVPGKVVVATSADEVAGLDALRRRAVANDIAVHHLDAAALSEREPHVRALAALLVPATGVVDFAAVCAALAAELSDGGVSFAFARQVTAVEDRDAPTAGGHGYVAVHTSASSGPSGAATLRASAVVNCAGLHSDTLAGSADVQIVPFRGEYYHLRPERAFLVRGLVYPVPDPRFPFLGVHLTRDVHGTVHAGPNAVPAFDREAYRWRDVRPRAVAATMAFAGARRLARQHWRTGVAEVVRSTSTARFAASLQRLVPELSPADLRRAPSGIRAQAVRRDGTLVDDFVFAGSARVIHVVNAPSPGATASLAIGAHIADLLDPVLIR